MVFHHDQYLVIKFKHVEFVPHRSTRATLTLISRDDGIFLVLLSISNCRTIATDRVAIKDESLNNRNASL